MGVAMARNFVDSPLIGVLPWGVVNSRNELERATGTTAGARIT